ncbi:hypothetical protein [Streptomyces sp. Inha503]|uniref:hypothetical protein n=1 Tax=Streptomyces sp. Inha503 TaxID=3383314 RepID=UPI0039A05613
MSAVHVPVERALQLEKGYTSIASRRMKWWDGGIESIVLFYNSTSGEGKRFISSALLDDPPDPGKVGSFSIDKGWDFFVLVSVGGNYYAQTYRGDGSHAIYQVKTDGSPDPVTGPLPGGKNDVWGSGWTSVEPFMTSGQQWLFLYNKVTGERKFRRYNEELGTENVDETQSSSQNFKIGPGFTSISAAEFPADDPSGTPLIILYTQDDGSSLTCKVQQVNGKVELANGPQPTNLFREPKYTNQLVFVDPDRTYVLNYASGSGKARNSIVSLDSRTLTPNHMRSDWPPNYSSCVAFDASPASDWHSHRYSLVLLYDIKSGTAQRFNAAFLVSEEEPP